MNKIILTISLLICLGFAQEQVNANKHLVGANLSTITGSGLVYRYHNAPFGFKVSSYLYSYSKDKETDFSLGGAFQYNIIVKPLTRLYALTGGSLRSTQTEIYKHRKRFIGVGFGTELRAFQTTKNEDLIFIMEIGESYFHYTDERRSNGHQKNNYGYIITFTCGVGIEF